MIVLVHANESHFDPLSTFHEHNPRLLLPLNSDAQEYFKEQSQPGLSSLLVTWREVSKCPSAAPMLSEDSFVQTAG